MSSGLPLFLDEPWGFLLVASKQSLVSDFNLEIEISGQGSPRVVTEFGQELKWLGGVGSPPVAGMPFRWKGKIYQAWHVPCSHVAAAVDQPIHHAWTVPSIKSQGTLLQNHVLGRPTDSEQNHESPAFNLDTLVNWLVNSFQELGHGKLKNLDSRVGGLIRRTWTSVNEVWLNPESEEPRIELIIKMAQDEPLLKVFESISRNPRRILLRVRQNTSLGRIQEMDAACIRNYARLPGQTPMQKAGTRQMLLSVQRTASYDTLENRLTCWTLANLRRRADQWRRNQTEKARGSQRSKAVFRLAKNSVLFSSTEALADVRYHSLAHPIPANYPLIMEPRYNRVYRAYRELLKYEKILDEAWTWRRALWAEGVSQLVSCALGKIWPLMHTSFPYYRTEPDRGRWMVAPCSAGPFKTPFGPLHIVDSHDCEAYGITALDRGYSGQGPLGSVGALGCDLILWLPDAKAAIVVWSVLWTGSGEGWVGLLNRAAEAIQNFKSGCDEKSETLSLITGIGIGTANQSTDIELDEGHSGSAHVTGLRLPMRIDCQDTKAFASIIANLRAGIEMAFGLIRR
jgi:hypothetical protein